MTTDPSHLAYLEKLESAVEKQCGGLRPSPQQIATLLHYLKQQENGNCVLLDLLSGEGTTCIAATKLGIVKKAIAINPRASSKDIAQKEGVFDQGNDRCEFLDVENILTSPPAQLLDNSSSNSHLSEQLKSATVIFCCAPPVLLKRLVPVMTDLLNDDNNKGSNDDNKKIVITMVHHIPEKHTIIDNVHDIPGTDLRVYHSLVVDKKDIPIEKPPVKVLEQDWIPAPPEPCDPGDIDKDFARGTSKLALPAGM